MTRVEQALADLEVTRDVPAETWPHILATVAEIQRDDHPHTDRLVLAYLKSVKRSARRIRKVHS